MELSRPVVVHYRDHLPICPIWVCPWAKNLSNLPQIGYRLCGTHVSDEWIYPIQSFMDLSWPVVVQCYSYLPYLGLPMGQKLVKSGSTWARFCRTHISETAVWIYTIQSSMELCNSMVIWLWPWIFKVKFWKCCISGMSGMIDMEPNGCQSIGCKTHNVSLNFDLTQDLDLGLFKVSFWNSCMSGKGWSFNMEQKGYESIGCYTYYVTVSYDLGFWRSNLKKKKLYHWNKMVDCHGT